jgi:hypothetical protein
MPSGSAWVNYRCFFILTFFTELTGSVGHCRLFRKQIMKTQGYVNGRDFNC